MYTLNNQGSLLAAFFHGAHFPTLWGLAVTVTVSCCLTGWEVTGEHNGFELDNKRISPDAMDALMRNEPLGKSFSRWDPLFFTFFLGFGCWSKTYLAVLAKL